MYKNNFGNNRAMGMISWQGVIGASMSEPHTSELNGNFFVCVCVCVCLYRTFWYLF